jgi:murein DD-endopeptidase MepM/ murein hydrolase activator NlpD
MDKFRIQSPVKGDWSFMNPPGHHPDAKDFVAINEKGAPYKRIKIISHMFFKLPVTDTYAWEREIYSPFEGTVIAMENSSQDRMELNIFRDLFNGLIIAPRNGKNDMKYFLGNYVVIKSKEGIYALLAHLRKGSVTVSKGMKISAGEVIANVGNSGNTILPHLHFQLMSENDISRAIPIPFIFNSCQVRNNGTWEPLCSTLPRNYQKFRV